MEEKKIYSALAEINRKVGALTKSRKNLQQGFMFRSIDDVMNELHSHFSEQGVLVIPEIENYDVKERISSKGGAMFVVRAIMKFHLTAADGSYITIRNVGEAMDSGDKGMNKAMSIALKYALLQLFLIPTEEKKDPDYYSDELHSMVGEILAKVKSATTREELTRIKEESIKNGVFGNVRAAMVARSNELGLKK
ncbi:MAG: ERF family protein [Bacteroidales bacterium]|nr:ERF family protein [Bacteroidales bacterium]